MPPVVRHRKVMRRGRPRHYYGDVDAAAGHVAHCVVEQVAHEHAERIAIAQHLASARMRRDRRPARRRVAGSPPSRRAPGPRVQRAPVSTTCSSRASASNCSTRRVARTTPALSRLRLVTPGPAGAPQCLHLQVERGQRAARARRHMQRPRSMDCCNRQGHSCRRRADGLHPAGRCPAMGRRVGRSPAQHVCGGGATIDRRSRRSAAPAPGPTPGTAAGAQREGARHAVRARSSAAPPGSRGLAPRRRIPASDHWAFRRRQPERRQARQHRVRPRQVDPHAVDRPHLHDEV